MPVQKRLAQISLAKQSAKGSFATVGTYQIGVTTGNVAKADVSENDLSLTWSSRVLEGTDRVSIIPGADFETVALPKTVAAMLYGVAGKIVSTPGSPNSHVITPGTDLPYWTLFGTVGTEFFKMTDAKIDSLELMWSTVEALRVKPVFKACGLSWPASAYTPGADERVKDGVLKGCGGTFTIDGAAATIKSGSIKFDNATDVVLGSDSVLPADIFPGQHTALLSFTVIPNDMTLWRKMITGTVAGTVPQCTSYIGTAEAKFKLDANNDLDFLANAARFAVVFPASDAGGGAQEVVLEGQCVVPAAGGDPYTITAHNAAVSY